MNYANHGQAKGKFIMSLPLQYTAVGPERGDDERKTAYRRFTTPRRTHNAIRPSESTNVSNESEHSIQGESPRDNDIWDTLILRGAREFYRI